MTAAMIPATTDHDPTPSLDEATAQLAERLLGSSVGALEMLAVHLGRQLGLYRALADGGPTTASALATRTGIAPRYAHEWLEQQAVSGFLNAGRQPLRAHEDILVFYDKQPAYDPQMVYTGRSSHSRGTKTERTVNHYGHNVNTPVVDQDGYQHPRSILTFKRPKMPAGKGHPNQKPVALMEWIVRSYCPAGGLVLDNVCGAGSTLVAARNAGRRAIGVEVREDYIAKTVARLESGAEGDQW